PHGHAVADAARPREPHREPRRGRALRPRHGLPRRGRVLPVLLRPRCRAGARPARPRRAVRLALAARRAVRDEPGPAPRGRPLAPGVTPDAGRRPGYGTSVSSSVPASATAWVVNGHSNVSPRAQVLSWSA